MGGYIMIKIIDLFCGTGGFSKGFENSTKTQFKVILGIDILKDSIATFKVNHKGAIGLCADINKIKKSSLVTDYKIGKDSIDLIIGGPPCQGFSSIRPFRSINDNDPRNNLYLSFVSFVDFFRPKMFIMENVVGLATHKGGETIEIIQNTFFSLGYETEWKILNAANYGVPQKRERLIILGAIKGAEISFPKPSHYFNGKTIGYKMKEKLVTATNDLFSNSLNSTITVKDAISDLPKISSGEEAKRYTNKPFTQYQKERRKENIQLTLHKSTEHSETMLEIIKFSGSSINDLPTGLVSSGFSTSYSRLNYNEPSVTLTVNFVHPASNKCIHPTQHRALTPREGARIQSFDDDFIFIGSRTNIVKQIGNAVPPLLGKAIADEISYYIQ
jgi:DNA (cytosine-5)-methyltransferase 1